MPYLGEHGCQDARGPELAMAHDKVAEWVGGMPHCPENEEKEDSGHGVHPFGSGTASQQQCSAM